jgi:hypothetical protein
VSIRCRTGRSFAKSSSIRCRELRLEAADEFGGGAFDGAPRNIGVQSGNTAGVVEGESRQIGVRSLAGAGKRVEVEKPGIKKTHIGRPEMGGSDPKVRVRDSLDHMN